MRCQRFTRDRCSLECRQTANWLRDGWMVGAEGSPKLQQAAKDYFEALAPLEQKVVLDSVELFRLGNKGIIDPDDYTAPLRIQKAAK